MIEKPNAENTKTECAPLPDGFLSILESVSEAVMVFDSSLTVVHANKIMHGILGQNPVGAACTEIEDRVALARNGVKSSLCAVLASAGVEGFSAGEFDAAITSPSAGILTFACRATSIVEDGKTTANILLTFAEKREDPHPEAFLREERNRLLRILDSIEDGIYICNGSFEMEYANPAIVSKFGNPAGKLCFDYLYDRDSRCPWCKGDEAFAGKTVHWEWRDPETGRVYDVIDTPLANPDGTVSKLKVFHDITDRKAEEQKLLLSKNRLESEIVIMNAELERSNTLLRERLADLSEKDRQLEAQSDILEKIFSNTRFLIAFLDSNFTFIRVNKTWSDSDGRPTHFFAGKSFFSVYADENVKRLLGDASVNASQSVGYGTRFSFPTEAARGASYWDWSLQPVKDGAGTTEGFILTLVDVTKRLEAEAELVKTRTALAEAKRLSDIGTLAATVAHELRNPLGVIQAAVYNIRRKSKDEALASHITNIENKLAESERIISNLLNYSSIKNPKPKPIHLFFFIDECIDTFVDQYRNRPVTMRRDFEAFRDVSVSIDPFQIREVLMNILHNAFQALPEEGGSVTVEGRLGEGDTVSITVSDTGEGIDQADMDKIFNPFFTRKSKGTGLGLTICQELVKLHCGEIRLESERGKGTRAIIVLPLRGPGP